ncbi:MAG: hypothetical protein J5J00_03090 [Deltaproteobacteria bacterium]|nr:hypothetical protein [Deltaproteobacteria bacterium]
MIDPSFLEAFHLLLKPFTEELGEGWKTVRALCVVFFVVAVVLWIFAFLTPETSFARAKIILKVSGWVAFLMFVFTYIACCLEARYLEKERHEDRQRKIREFH